MCNRFKRRSCLILLFSIQIILFSTYVVVHYYNHNPNPATETAELNALTISDHLPAGFIEKKNRSLLKKNYKNKEFRQKFNSRTNKKLESLNVSFVKDTDQQTVIQCPLLPVNLGNFTMNRKKRVFPS